MWQKQFSKVYPNITKEEIWQVWADVNNWPQWDSELVSCDMTADFISGTQFNLKPEGGPTVIIVLSDVVPNEQFSNYCKFLGATMHDNHVLTEEPEGIRISHTLKMTGPLSFIWTHLVAKNVAHSIPTQTDNLVEYARAKRG